MQLIYLETRTGETFVGPLVPDHFNIQNWANSRQASFRLLEIVRIVYYPLGESNSILSCNLSENC